MNAKKVTQLRLSILWLLLLPLVISASLFLHHRHNLIMKGYCLAEKRVLSERELLERYVLGPTWPKMTEEERQQKLSSIEHFPHCCRIRGRPITLNERDMFWNAVFGEYIYGVEAIFPNISGDDLSPYIEILASINACGTKMDSDRYKMPIAEATYLSTINVNKLYWEGQLK